MKKSDFILPRGKKSKFNLDGVTSTLCDSGLWKNWKQEPFVQKPCREYDGRVKLNPGVVPGSYIVAGEIVYQGILGGPARPIGYVKNEIAFFNGTDSEIGKVVRTEKNSE